MGEHLSNEQLARFQDGYLPHAGVSHLAACPDCARRLRDIETANAAYKEYRNSVRPMPPAPRPWLSLNALIEKDARRTQSWRWWLIPGFAAVLCLLIVTVVVLHRPAQQAPVAANELLTRSASVELPPNRLISIRVRGRILVRPAVLETAQTAERDPDLAHLQMVFTAANYSWREPLSARSFQAWRRGLRGRRDSVSVVQAGNARMYRVQTDTSDGALRRVSLTLKGNELRPANGAFQFEGENPLEMDETAAPVSPAVRRTAPAETPASPEDTLHVLAALNELGADVGEPVEVTEDAGHHHVVVRAGGLSPERQREIAQALKSLPRVELALDSGSSSNPLPARSAAPERYSTNIPGSFRQQLEDKMGGAVKLQEVSDRVLEISASILGRVHAIEVLAEKFPPEAEARLATPDRDLLRTLRQRHAMVLKQLVADIRTELKPLLPVPDHAQPTATLAASARELDGLLNQLLASSYSQGAGEEMLRSLGSKLENFEAAVESQVPGGR